MADPSSSAPPLTSPPSFAFPSESVSASSTTPSAAAAAGIPRIGAAPTLDEKPKAATIMGMVSTNGAGAGSNTPTGDLLNNASATQVRPGGAPARVYLNEKVVPYLLEGMKTVTKDQPPNPLRVLGEFLLQKSNEVEGGATGSNQ